APLAIICLLAAVGAAWLVAAAPLWPLRLAVAGLLALGAYSYVDRRVDLIDSQVRSADKVAKLNGDLETAVRRAGGPNAVTRYGGPTINHGFATHLAWLLKSRINYVGLGDGGAVVFEARTWAAGRPGELRRDA